MTVLDEIQSAIQSISSAAGPAIVGIGRRQRGSGVVIGPGLILTNAHNVRRPQTTVAFADGRRELGTVAAIDPDGDLAVIRTETGSVTPLEWGATDGLALGAVVFGAAASPSGGARVTFGTVSAVARAFRGPGGRRIDGSVEHTAPLAPGSSGGALLDAAGRVVGINTNRLGEGFYLARPADQALRDRVAALGRGETARRARLGVAVAPSHVARRLRRSVGLPDVEGLLVRGVEEGSPGAAAGIQQGDLITSVAGRAVTDIDALADAIAAGAAAGATYEVVLVRGVADLTVTVGAAADGGSGTGGSAGQAGGSSPKGGRTPGDA